MEKVTDFQGAKNKRNKKNAIRTHLEMKRVLAKLLKNQQLTMKDQELINDYYKAMTLFGGLSMMREEAKIEAYSLIERYVGDLSLLYDSDIRRLFSKMYDAYLTQEENVQFKM